MEQLNGKEYEEQEFSSRNFQENDLSGFVFRPSTIPSTHHSTKLKKPGFPSRVSRASLKNMISISAC